MKGRRKTPRQADAPRRARRLSPRGLGGGDSALHPAHGHLLLLTLIQSRRSFPLPCRATIRLAMQSGTLVPAARKVMPMMTSGIPRVKPITVTYRSIRCDPSGCHQRANTTTPLRPARRWKNVSSHHPDHDVGEAGDPQGGGDEGEHEPVVPARLGAVGDGEVEQQAERPGKQPLQFVASARCKHTARGVTTPRAQAFGLRRLRQVPGHWKGTNGPSPSASSSSFSLFSLSSFSVSLPSSWSSRQIPTTLSVPARPFSTPLLLPPFTGTSESPLVRVRVLMSRCLCEIIRHQSWPVGQMIPGRKTQQRDLRYLGNEHPRGHGETGSRGEVTCDHDPHPGLREG